MNSDHLNKIVAVLEPLIKHCSIEFFVSFGDFWMFMRECDGWIEVGNLGVSLGVHWDNEEELDLDAVFQALRERGY